MYKNSRILIHNLNKNMALYTKNMTLYTKNKDVNINVHLTQQKFIRDKLDNILSPETKEYLKLDKQLKKERELEFKMKNNNHISKHTQYYSSIFWGIYGTSLFSVYAGFWYLFDK